MTTTTTAPAANSKKPAVTSATEASPLQIRRIGTERLLIPIKGTAGLIVHAWSEKAKRQMLDAMQNVKRPKEKRDPEADYEASMYYCNDGRYGIPSLSFKGAIVSSSRFYGKSCPATMLRQAVFIGGVRNNDPKSTQLLTPIIGEPVMREDCVRVGINGTDLRYRAEFPDWTAVIDLRYVTSLLSRESVLSLVDAAGFGVGLCEWRPERNGANGTFEIDESKEVEVIDGRH